MLAILLLRAKNERGRMPVHVTTPTGLNSRLRALRTMITVDPAMTQLLHHIRLPAHLCYASSGTCECPTFDYVNQLLQRCGKLIILEGGGGAALTQRRLEGVSLLMLRKCDVSLCPRVTSLISFLPLECSTLQVLILSSSGVTQSGIAGLRTPRLQKLDISNCSGITDVHTLLSRCRTLTSLNLSGTNVSQKSIRGLSFPKIQALYLSDCRLITDLNVLLRGAEELKVLILSGSGVTQQGIAYVVSPAIQKLMLRDCSGITNLRMMVSRCPLQHPVMVVMPCGTSHLACIPSDPLTTLWCPILHTRLRCPAEEIKTPSGRKDTRRGCVCS